MAAEVYGPHVDELDAHLYDLIGQARSNCLEAWKQLLFAIILLAHAVFLRYTTDFADYALYLDPAEARVAWTAFVIAVGIYACIAAVYVRVTWSHVNEARSLITAMRENYGIATEAHLEPRSRSERT